MAGEVRGRLRDLRHLGRLAVEQEEVLEAVGIDLARREVGGVAAEGDHGAVGADPWGIRDAVGGGGERGADVAGEDGGPGGLVVDEDVEAVGGVGLMGDEVDGLALVGDVAAVRAQARSSGAGARGRGGRRVAVVAHQGGRVGDPVVDEHVAAAGEVHLPGDHVESRAVEGQITAVRAQRDVAGVPRRQWEMPWCGSPAARLPRPGRTGRRWSHRTRHSGARRRSGWWPRW